MVITFVIDTYGKTTNGTTITAMRSAAALRARGHKVNIITGSEKTEEDVYSTGIRKTPILYQVCKTQGMPLAKANKKVLEKVIKESDIVHYLLPFKLSKVGAKISKKYDIPMSAAFHVQPENITSTLYLNKVETLNKFIYKYFKKYYKQFDHIHLPSQMIKEQLEKHQYKGKLHVISNGVSNTFQPMSVNKPKLLKDKIIILMIGRLSREKRQDLIIEAVKKSKHEAEIQIIFAGMGPWKSHLEEIAKSLTNQPIMRFFEQKSLIELINYADLYIHASDVEIEAISCIEAFSCGLVPVIANSEISATKQFALSNDNLFKRGDANDLTAKMDYLLEHHEVRNRLKKAYIEYGKTFSLEHSIDLLEAMFEETIKDHHKRK